MRIWAVAGGKGGTGKSLVANGLAMRLGEGGARVVLADADFGGANQHTYCGLRRPAASLGDFFEGRRGLEEILQGTRLPGVSLLPGNLNSANTDGLTSAQKLKFFRHLKRLEADHVILDLGAGTQYDTLDSFLLADLQVAVIAPEALSLENFYLFIKNLQFRQLAAVLSQVGLRDRARDIWKHRDAHGITTVLSFIAHLEGLSEPFAELMARERRRLRVTLVLNQVREFRQVELGQQARLAVSRFFHVPTEFAGYIHHDKDLWHLVGQGEAPALLSASYALKHDLERVTAAILESRAEVPA